MNRFKDGNIKVNDTMLKKGTAFLLAITFVLCGAAYGCKKANNNNTTYSNTTESTTIETTIPEDNFISYTEALEIAKNNMPEGADFTIEELAVAIVFWSNEDSKKVAEELKGCFTKENNSTSPEAALKTVAMYLGLGGKLSVLSENNKLEELDELKKSSAYSTINDKILDIVKDGTAKEEVLALLFGLTDMKNINTDELKVIFEERGNAAEFVLSQANEEFEQLGIENTQPATKCK